MKQLMGFLVVTVLVGFGAEALADQVQLGSTTLTNRPDVDVIGVRSCSTGKGRFRRIRLQVNRRAAEIYDIDVQYGNGSWDTYVPVRRYFGRGTTSRWIDLIGGRRCIKRIVIKGDTEGPRRRPLALVTFFGLR